MAYMACANAPRKMAPKVVLRLMYWSARGRSVGGISAGRLPGSMSSTSDGVEAVEGADECPARGAEVL